MEVGGKIKIGDTVEVNSGDRLGEHGKVILDTNLTGNRIFCIVEFETGQLAKNKKYLTKKSKHEEEEIMGVNNLKRQYTALHKNSGIKCGDVVKVLRDAKSFEMGWDNLGSKMSGLIGKKLRVSHDLGKCGFLLEDRFPVPFFILEKIKSPDEITYEDALRLHYNMWKEISYLALNGQGVENFSKKASEGFELKDFKNRSFLCHYFLHIKSLDCSSCTLYGNCTPGYYSFFSKLEGTTPKIRSVAANKIAEVGGGMYLTEHKN